MFFATIRSGLSSQRRGGDVCNLHITDQTGVKNQVTEDISRRALCSCSNPNVERMTKIKIPPFEASTRYWPVESMALEKHRPTHRLPRRRRSKMVGTARSTSEHDRKVSRAKRLVIDSTPLVHSCQSVSVRQNLVRLNTSPGDDIVHVWTDNTESCSYCTCSVSSTSATCATNSVAAWQGNALEHSTKPFITSLSLHPIFTVTFSPGFALFTLT